MPNNRKLLEPTQSLFGGLANLPIIKRWVCVCTEGGGDQILSLLKYCHVDVGKDYPISESSKDILSRGNCQVKALGNFFVVTMGHNVLHNLWLMACWEGSFNKSQMGQMCIIFVSIWHVVNWLGWLHIYTKHENLI